MCYKLNVLLMSSDSETCETLLKRRCKVANQLNNDKQKSIGAQTCLRKCYKENTGGFHENVGLLNM